MAVQLGEQRNTRHESKRFRKITEVKVTLQSSVGLSPAR
jgi:hypothetical protein